MEEVRLPPTRIPSQHVGYEAVVGDRDRRHKHQGLPDFMQSRQRQCSATDGVRWLAGL